MVRLGGVFLVLAMLLRPAWADTLLPGLVQEYAMVPAALPDGRTVQLEAMVLRPDRPGPVPLVVMVHGTPRGNGPAWAAELAEQGPASFIAPAVAFAQRGYAVASIMRQGFGHSDGPFRELLTGDCARRDYLHAARLAAEDVLGAVAALRRQPWVDPERVVLLGHSTGGTAVTAAAASNPPGVVALLNLAGGHGNYAPDQICNPDGLARDFGVFGMTARIPALWLYGENDHFVPATLGRRLFEAYTDAGAPAEWRLLPPTGADGHYLLNVPVDLWWPAAETFLRRLGLPSEMVLQLPPLAALPPPEPLSQGCASFFAGFVDARIGNKAFAWNRDGHCSATIGRRPEADASETALRTCRAAWGECSLYAVGQVLAGG